MLRSDTVQPQYDQQYAGVRRTGTIGLAAWPDQRKDRGPIHRMIGESLGKAWPDQRKDRDPSSKRIGGRSENRSAIQTYYVYRGPDGPTQGTLKKGLQ